MDLKFYIIAGFVLAGAIAAMSLRKLVHCAICLAAVFVGIAALFLRLNAGFVAFAQVLVYVGAVAILILFAILLTNSHQTNDEPSGKFASFSAIITAALSAGTIISALFTTRALPASASGTVTEISTATIGHSLMSDFVLPLEIIAVLLTVSMLGAVVIAIQENKKAAPLK